MASSADALKYKTFANALRGLGAQASRALFDDLIARYSEPSRYYHDASHVSECLLQLARCRHLAGHLAEIEIAIWFHDAIYDSKQADNEERSAQLAARELKELGARAASIDAVVEMILATKTHVAKSADAKLMLDIDLGILGTSPEVFEEYDANIRREFAWVPEEIYRVERRRVLESFLARGSIYQTPKLREELELRARENLSRKIAELQQSPGKK